MKEGERGGLTVALVREMIDEAEMSGDVLRDDGECVIFQGDEAGEGQNGSGRGGMGLFGIGEAGVRWWPNVFVGYVWDGQTFDDND